MGLLFPIYLLGALAIGVPIILHLIKRTPQGKQMFSTLMFLQPSPPRLTRRSRLTNILLLLLRALAIILLALAFMRPFFTWNAAAAAVGGTGRRVAILVDISASMQRGNLWAQATHNVDVALGDLSPTDQVGLYFFDTQVHPGFTFQEWSDAAPGDRIALLQARLKQTKPGWGGTRLGDAMSAMADAVSQNDRGMPDNHTIDRHIVLISDLQEGSHIETLQGREWPKDVYYVPMTVSTTPGNASLQWIAPALGDKADGTVRIKVSNESDSPSEQFSLAWSDAKGPLAGVAAEKAYVPPGQSRIIRMKWPEQAQPDRIVLSGDAADFDNTLYLAQPRVEVVKVLYIGADAAKDPNAMRYYLESALADTARRHVEIIGKKATEDLTDADLAGVRLVVVGAMRAQAQGSDEGEVTPAAADKLRQYVNAGGDVLWVLRDVASARPLSALLGEELKLDEVTGGFALISRIDVTHPLFAPFADARYGDFTQVHFWRWRKLDLKDPTGVIAWFDSGDPFMLERFIGAGRVRIMTSGWNPSDSQLGHDGPKFVPLMEQLLRRRDDVTVEAQYTVGDPVALPEAAAEAARTMHLPDGRKLPLEAAKTFAGDDVPGIYALEINGKQTPIAVNVAADESRTVPLANNEPEKFGATMGRRETLAEAAAAEQHLRSEKLENQQKLWRWLIIAVLGLLGAETFLAGRQARRSTQEKVPL